jgi:hypothetical protein
MVIKGASRRNIGFWSGHLKDTKKNDRAEMIDRRGLAAEDLRGMMREMLEGASATRCKNFMYIASFNPTEGQTLTEEQWQRTFEIFEKARGIPDGQARVVFEHEKKGRIHRHVVWDRIDTENMRAFPDGLDWKVCQAASLEISQELGIERPTGILDREPGTPRPERRPESWEMFRGQKSEIDPRDVKAEVTAIYRESDSAAEFMAGLEAKGYLLCQGDRRGFVILDHAGDTHSLARRLDGITAKQLNAFMEGIDRAALPSVSQGKEKQQEQKQAALAADRATVAPQIEWEDQLAQAAIEKEKVERQFVEPGNAPPETRGADPQQKSAELSGTAAEIRAAYSQTNTGPEFANALEDKGLILAAVDRDDIEGEKVRTGATEKWKELREGELVVINQSGHLYRLTERNTGESRKAVAERLKDIDRASLLNVKDARAVMDDLKQHRLDERAAHFEAGRRERPLRGSAIDIRFAYRTTADAQAFVASLAERGIVLAVPTKAEAEESHKQAEAARAEGRSPHATGFKEHETVAVDQWGHVYRLSERITGSSFGDMQRYLRTLDRSTMLGIEDVRDYMRSRAE